MQRTDELITFQIHSHHTSMIFLIIFMYLTNLDVALKIRTGRYECLLIENGICFNNNFQINNCIEDEKHVQHMKIASVFIQACLFV